MRKFGLSTGINPSTKHFRFGYKPANAIKPLKLFFRKLPQETARRIFPLQKMNTFQSPPPDVPSKENLAHRFVASIVGIDSHRRLAAGLALGFVIGFLPKDSLFVVIIGLVGLLSTANLITLLIGAVVISLIGPNFDWLFDRIGFSLLSQPALQPMFAELSTWPIFVWTRFDNTVVVGSLIVGLLLFWPTYLGGCIVFKFFRPKLILFLANRKSTRWLARASDRPDVG